MDVQLYSNGGCSLDLTESVMDRALLHSDCCYKIPNVRVVGRLCRTNQASNTAFRGFGGPQVRNSGCIELEEILVWVTTGLIES